ncbi:Hypothetical predicted protein [Podarcis lilfordi]|uniref:Uncharacterized protein n=1 Tax=Podarcis lilfordi TaxID=74358 RepID=A0AA35P773_9SAUR|nr:Hypothetical predicted protein [Podarcis lilfordi]
MKPLSTELVEYKSVHYMLQSDFMIAELNVFFKKMLGLQHKQNILFCDMILVQFAYSTTKPWASLSERPCPPFAPPQPRGGLLPSLVSLLKHIVLVLPTNQDCWFKTLCLI